MRDALSEPRGRVGAAWRRFPGGHSLSAESGRVGAGGRMGEGVSGAQEGISWEDGKDAKVCAGKRVPRAGVRTMSRTKIRAKD